MNRLRYDAGGPGDEVVNVESDRSGAADVAEDAQPAGPRWRRGLPCWLCWRGRQASLYALRPPEATAPLPADSASTTTTSAATDGAE
ncbi:hypothetical protein GCM10020218_100980 [Dactylosporangium vinaceum]